MTLRTVIYTVSPARFEAQTLLLPTGLRSHMEFLSTCWVKFGLYSARQNPAPTPSMPVLNSKIFVQTCIIYPPRTLVRSQRGPPQAPDLSAMRNSDFQGLMIGLSLASSAWLTVGQVRSIHHRRISSAAHESVRRRFIGAMATVSNVMTSYGFEHASPRRPAQYLDRHIEFM